MDKVTATKKIKELMVSKKIILGTDLTLKGLKQGNVKTVFVTVNCPVNVKEDIAHYANVAGAKVENLEDVTNKDLGVICRKSFDISVMSETK